MKSVSMIEPHASKGLRNGLGFYIVFFAAGLPALIYQVAWQRVLTFYFGVDLYSTSVTVGSFMLGLGLGALGGGQLADGVKRPAHVYALVEFLIGCIGVASIGVFSLMGELFAGSSLGILIPVNFALLLVPAMLMGMTLPLMCRIIKINNQNIGRHLSSLYGANTLGAAFGAFVTAYLLLGTLGMDGACYFAASINFFLALTTLFISRAGQPGQEKPTDRQTSPAALASQDAASLLRRSDFIVLSFLSGVVGLGYEIAWYRVLGCLLHGTVYVFGTILGIYLLGISLGSFVSRKRIDQRGAAQRFALSQVGIALYTFALFVLVGNFSWLPGLRHLIAASSYTTFHPAPELFAGEVNLLTLYSLLDIPFWTILVLGVPTLLMGYGFPNLMRAASQSVSDLGRSVGGVYFANILGSTMGTLLVGFVSIHYLGAEVTLLLLVCLGFLPTLIILRREFQTGTASAWSRRRTSSLLATFSSLVAALCFFPGPGEIVRAIHYADYEDVEVVSAVEDRSGVVLLKNQRKVITFPEEAKAVNTYRLYIDGANHGGLRSLDRHSSDEAVRWALAAHANPRRVLCIGLGNGSMCAAAVECPQVEELVVVELNTALASVLQKTSIGRAVLESPKTRLLHDDGRRWLLANAQEKFDVVMMFPLHAAHAHSGNLFSLEFFDLVKSRLSEKGLLFFHSVDCQSTAKTVATAFPYVLRANRTAYLASQERFAFDLRRLGWTAEEFCDYVEVGSQEILASTQETAINYDLRPNAEFYLTYAHRKWLSPRCPEKVYMAREQAPFADFISPVSYSSANKKNSEGANTLKR
ncbi:MAG: fused MFS/spermidine synthase [Pirellulales bacterium]|nr:fused MFS/spermidine synthase [Pirellulales bacterium]